MKSGDKIKFAVVGVGRIGKRHIEMIAHNPYAELISVCDIRSKEECQYSGDETFYSSYSQMLETEKLDIVCVCTPNHLHYTFSEEALLNSLHVIVEKPIALETLHCEKLIALSEEKGKTIFTVMQNRYSPPSKWIKSVVDEGLLGEIYMVQVQCYWNRHKEYYQNSNWKGELEKDGGTLFTQFSHFVDIMYWLFGDIKNIRSQFFNFNHKGLTEFEDSGNSIFEFVNGGAGTFSFSTSVNEQNYKSSILIIAEKGTVKIGGQYMNEVEFCRIEDYTLPQLEKSQEANDYGDYKGSASNHHFVIDNAIATLRGKASIGSTAYEGLKIVDMIERMYQAGKERPVHKSKAMFENSSK